MCTQREYILLLLKETETGFSAIWNGEPQNQPWMPSSVSFWSYKLAGKSYYSGPGEYRSGWQPSPQFAQLLQPKGLETELQLHGRSFSHKDFTANKTPYAGPFILKFFWTSAWCFWEPAAETLESQSSKFYRSFAIQPWEPHKPDRNSCRPCKLHTYSGAVSVCKSESARPKLQQFHRGANPIAGSGVAQPANSWPRSLQPDRTQDRISRRFDNASHSAAGSKFTEWVNTWNFREPDRAREFGSFAESTDRFNPIAADRAGEASRDGAVCKLALMGNSCRYRKPQELVTDRCLTESREGRHTKVNDTFDKLVNPGPPAKQLERCHTSRHG